MVDQEIYGRWYEVAERLYHRGLIGDLLGAPGNIISQVLSPPAATTQESVKAEVTTPAATSQAAAVPATTQAAAAPPAATTQQAAAPPASTPKQEEQHPTTIPAAQAPATTNAPAQQQPTSAAVANAPANNHTPPAAEGAAGSTTKTSAAPAISTNAASTSMLADSSGTAPVGTSSGFRGVDATKSGVTISTQTPQTPVVVPQGNETVNQTPLVATGVVLGIVVLMGISLLIFWCYRRRRKANLHHQAALSPENPPNEYCGVVPRLRVTTNQNVPPMAENRGVSLHDQLMVHHPQPQPDPVEQLEPQADDSTPERSNPYSGLPFTYAQAQQYAQSHGAFSIPVPPIPEPSPIRIFRWPTRSSRSAASSARSAISGWHTSKGPSRAVSRASRSTTSSMLWHGRRDVIARRTMTQTPSSQKNGFLAANTPESTMPEGLHTPILDWLHWIRGNQSEGDPEMNHRKSFVSVSESSISEGSLASSGVFSPTLLSWPPPDNDASPVINHAAFAYLPMPLQLKRETSDGERYSGSPSTRGNSYY
ncbi:uncharacterized protein CTRU02_210769 [Colletotrichum truncatum]|uniref:Uncharacterized protein n=1 Tax=Colletotrichum truncatum TaxID=5467 RepID=A0ACC3YPY4_COLTU|nr:uncharacterized protein CTRU02_03744 [Colletotrichum truncatum]KAF6796766.1 hypothetical protein CTRU02_03744 [Colletotrichum truncatum]